MHCTVSKFYLSLWLSLAWPLIIVPHRAVAQDFDRLIAPILAHHCLSCHSGTEPKGKLDLSSRGLAMAGGESGRVIEPHDLHGSLLWEYVATEDMPPKKPLSKQEKSLLKAWIEAGAMWGTEVIDPFRFSTDQRAGNDWWSLQPLSRPQPPTESSPGVPSLGAAPPGWSKNPVDAFVYARLRSAGLSPSSPADRRTLIRRLSFDLLGLPPTPAEIEVFLNDRSDQAYEHLVDRYLESPHYGERWARHWLDVVRFGESNGFEYDQPRDHAWPYRNWVINALNQDLPYDEFVRLQLAGDVLRPEELQANAAAGFLVAGPHNTTLPANEPMRMTMAQDELEDLVGVVAQTFLGLTANCARCHDHKFDPISQQEYYQLAATLSGVTHGERTFQVALPLQSSQRIEDIDLRLKAIEAQRAAMEQPARLEILAELQTGQVTTPTPPRALVTWEFDENLTGIWNAEIAGDTTKLSATAHGEARLEDGCLVLNGKTAYVETQLLPFELREKTLEAWVKLDNLDQRGGGVISLQTQDGNTFDAIVFGEREPQRWMAGSNSFVRTQAFDGQEEGEAQQREVHIAIVYGADGTIIGYRDGLAYGQPYQSKALQPFSADRCQVLFGLRHRPAGGNRMLAGRIQRAQLYNYALTAEQVAASAKVVERNHVTEAQLLERLTFRQRSERDELLAASKRLLAERETLVDAQSQQLYTCVSSEPGITRVLMRGNVSTPGQAVAPAGLSAVAGADFKFGLTADASDADRRQKLAEWITHRDNPLFARVMVNRLWHYHFGQGLVRTPSDFGYNGGLPSHPELLDWLAGQFQDESYRLKPLHRLLVTSATYRQSSAANTDALRVDADNHLLWRKSPQRLEAEEIRDAVLVVTGELDREIGGRGYRDVRHYPFKGSNFYESIEEARLESHRRTIYRFAPRGGRNPFLDTFDCPDPSATTPNRATTTTPIQALALLNNALIFDMADKFAARLTQEAGKQVDEQIRSAFLIAFGRPANADEVRWSLAFAEEFGIASLCRVLLNCNEFLYVR